MQVEDALRDRVDKFETKGGPDLDMMMIMVMIMMMMIVMIMAMIIVMIRYGVRMIRLISVV